MPIFEYRCATCRQRFELLVTGAADSGRACPSCGGTALQRLPSTFAVIGGAVPRPGEGACCQERPGDGGCACGRN